MLYQRGAHNGSNMGERMHSYPMYQDIQKKAAPFSEVLCRRLVDRVGQRRQPDRTRGNRNGVGEFLQHAGRQSRGRTRVQFAG